MEGELAMRSGFIVLQGGFCWNIERCGLDDERDDRATNIGTLFAILDFRSARATGIEKLPGGPEAAGKRERFF